MHSREGGSGGKGATGRGPVASIKSQWMNRTANLGITSTACQISYASVLLQHTLTAGTRLCLLPLQVCRVKKIDLQFTVSDAPRPALG